MKSVPIPSGEPAGRIVCPRCGNAKNFVEVAGNVLVTTHFIQNRDGSFTTVDRETENLGEVKLYCGHCSTDVSQFHSHLHEMIF
jgi:hypothetical protein